MAYGLVNRIYDHAFEQGWLKEGDVVCDPFGGVCTTGIIGAYRNVQVVAVELEQKFVDLARENFELHRRKWEGLNCPQPVIIQGDSREMCTVLGAADCILSSPPYSETALSGGQTKGGQGCTQGKRCLNDYGSTHGNLGNLKPGDVDAIVSSPPFEAAETRDRTKFSGGRVAVMMKDAYTQDKQGTTPGNISNDKGPTFWEAAAVIVQQCHQILKPGGHAIWVVKAFVRKGNRVDFPGDWRRLCESVGFVTVCTHHAMLVKETTDEGLFGGLTDSKEKKSFFRRLSERNAAWKKYWETVPSEHEQVVWRFRASLMGRFWSEPPEIVSPLAICFAASGEDERDWNAHVRIDYEVILCMEK